MDLTTKEWNGLVWKLHSAEDELDRFFGRGLINEEKYRRGKDFLSKLWTKIWELHPDQHPEATRIFKQNF